jgi:ribosomal protein S18 acetylase RimI-like enzyme
MPPPHPTSPRVFRASTEDLDLARVAIGEVHQRLPVDEQALVAFLASATCYLFVSVIAGEVVGSLNGYCLPHPSRSQPQFLLYEIDVKKTWRRRGLGVALADAFLSEARASGASDVWVVTNDSNQGAMAMYRRCGFVRRHPDDVMLSIML